MSSPPPLPPMPPAGMPHTTSSPSLLRDKRSEFLPKPDHVPTTVRKFEEKRHSTDLSQRNSFNDKRASRHAVLLQAGSPTGATASSPHTTASKVELAALQIELDTLLAHAHSVAAVQQAIRAHDEIVAASNSTNGTNATTTTTSGSALSRSPGAMAAALVRRSSVAASPSRVVAVSSSSPSPTFDDSMRRIDSKSPPPPAARAPSDSVDSDSASHPPSLPSSVNSTLKMHYSPSRVNDDDDSSTQERPEIPPTPPSATGSPPPIPAMTRPTPPRVPPPLAPLPPVNKEHERGLVSSLVDKLKVDKIAASNAAPSSAALLNGSPKRDSPKRDSPGRLSPASSSPGRSGAAPIDSPSRRKSSSRRPSAPSTPKALSDSSKANKKLSSSSRKEKKPSKRGSQPTSVAPPANNKKSPKIVVNLHDSEDDDSEQRLLRALEQEALEASQGSSHESDDDAVNATTVLHEMFGLLRNGETDRLLQLAENWHSALDFNRRDPNGRTLLCLAATVGDADTTQRLLTFGAKPSATTALGTSPLHCAAYHGRADVCSLLLELDIEASAANKHGLTPLHCALSSNQHHIVPLLVGAGAAFAARDANGSTPLHVGCTLGHVASVRALLRAIEGTKPDGAAAVASALAAKDDAELTPLMCAVWQNNVSCVELLVRHGAKNDADRDGLTPLSVASNEAIKQILVRAFVSGDDAVDDGAVGAAAAAVTSPTAASASAASTATAPESGSLTARRRHREAEDARRRKQSMPAIAVAASSPAGTVQEQEASVSFEGPLLVREGALRKQWVERYATLANGELSCYGDKLLAKTGSDPLWFVTVDETVELVPLKDGKAAHAELSFSLLVRNKTVLLRAKTPEDKLTWVNKINLLKYSRQHGGTAGLHLLAREASGQQRSISSSGERGGTFFRVPSQASKTSPLASDKASRRPLAVPALDLAGAGVAAKPAAPAKAAGDKDKHDDDDDGVLDSSESETDNMPVPTVNLSKADRRKSIRRLQHDSGMEPSGGSGHHHRPHKSPRELSPRFKLPHVPTRRAVASRRAASIARGEDPDADPDDEQDDEQQ